MIYIYFKDMGVGWVEDGFGLELLGFFKEGVIELNFV